VFLQEHQEENNNMRFRTVSRITAILLIGGLAFPVQWSAQEQKAERRQKKEHHRYRLVDVGTFGGPESNLNPVGNGGPYINRHGTAVGTSATSVPSGPTANGFFCGGLDGTLPFVFHAFDWKNGVVTDLGALPPAVSNCSDAIAVNSRGMIAGGSENGLVDPATGVNEIHAIVWNDGRIEDLGTFGGNFSVAASLNSRGQVAGFALNGISDPFSMFAVVLGGPSAGTQTRAFLWEDGHMEDLGTLGGPDAWGFFVNEHGQVAGYSYTNSTANSTTGFPTVDPFLWKNGKMVDLGTLGGNLGTPSALNNSGQVIGSSNLAGDQASDAFFWDGEKLIDLTKRSAGNIVTANAINDAGEIVGAECLPNNGPCHAYLWKSGVVSDLGTLTGDCFSQAFAINSKAQVVGQSFNCDTQIGRIFLWDDGTMIDLNSFVPPGSGLQLAEAVAINDRGEIAGDLLPPDCGGGIVPTQGNDAKCGHAFVLVPCEKDETNCSGCRSDEDADGNATGQSNGTSVSQAQTTAPQANLTPSEMKERTRAFLANRNRRFRGFPKN
jgi:probable HAF family extracellular repeat protein